MTENQQAQEPKKKRTHSAFKPEEDIMLISLVNQYGLNNWNEIANHMPNRSKRQCKERYLLFLSPNIKNAPWTYEEDLKLIQMLKIFGKRWTMIAKFFNGRSDINIKNRYHMRVKDLIDKDIETPQNKYFPIPILSCTKEGKI
ncbi:hypothetical protein M9Y10_016793 [Tritrichomonas musculus]|uniref:Myb-like DNA-binding domain containing protein n=1 Tax=Tritrichomonas musculus TaxID=1915356 RepID=A0ABR2HY60_9EUKA